MPSDQAAYTRRDYDRYVGRTLIWLGAGAACIAAGGLLGLRRGLSARTVSASLACAAACAGMGIHETLRDLERSRR
ncbi:MAG: hypothetical protein INR65_15595 [Gluconacetobacter diazotrophicus]|nr:hypothetical protein [Gluconacetobacter diazotrophicus]